MSDKMYPIKIEALVNWIFQEYKSKNSIFEIDKSYFNFPSSGRYKLFNQNLDIPLGPAAGPHTQLSQNIISSFLVGARFFELKTVQILDELKIEKPCIDMTDEGYNTEWSQELKLHQSIEEYYNSYLLIKIIDFLFNKNNPSNFIFNISVGYNLEGIKSASIDNFINSMMNASSNSLFGIKKNQLIDFFKNHKKLADTINYDLDELSSFIENISPYISNNVTLSTMHGCPANEIEQIAKYLIKEKRLNTFIKLNPTLLGFDFVNEVLKNLGYDYINLDRHSFENDLQFDDSLKLIYELTRFSKNENLGFGIKLSNTLGVKNNLNRLPGGEMYMSGRALFPLTINLAYKLTSELQEEIPISYSGGANQHNIKDILFTGIYPITVASDLLKPGGYYRLFHLANEIKDIKSLENNFIDLDLLKKLADDSLKNIFYKKNYRETKSIKVKSQLPIFDCYIAPCKERCPIHQDVPEYISLFRENRLEEAFESIIRKNPLPHITGYICDHQCMNHCTRWDYDSTLQIREIKKAITLGAFDKYFEKLKENTTDKKIKVAIIGAGPSGLSVAYFLAKENFEVTVFEKRKSAGGVVKNIIPEFRLPNDVIEKDIELVKKMGVKFVFNYYQSIDIKKLHSDGFKYIYFGIGAEVSNELKINSDKKIIDVLELLEEIKNGKEISLGENVAIIGGGNSAMDAARVSKRLAGVKNVYLIYRRTEEFMPADKEEIEGAKTDGVIFKELLLPVAFYNNELKCQKMALTDFDKDGRRKVQPLENEFENLKIDSVIAAIGEQLNKNVLESNNIKCDWESLTKFRKNNNETNIPNVYLGGDALRGPSTVVESIEDGRTVAKSILMKEGIVSEKAKIDFRNSEKEIQNTETIKGKLFSRQLEIINEAERCLNCDLICNKCVDVCPNRANVSIKVAGFENRFQIIHIDGMCNECGNCETFCPHTGKPYKDKFTIFWCEEDFFESGNVGMIITNNKIKLRIKENEILECTLSGEEIHFPKNDLDENYKRIIKSILDDSSYLTKNIL